MMFKERMNADEAKELFLSALSPVSDIENLPIEDCDGRIICEDIVYPMSENTQKIRYKIERASDQQWRKLVNGMSPREFESSIIVDGYSKSIMANIDYNNE